MSDFNSKCTEIDFGWGCAQTLLGELTTLPQTPSWNKGDLILNEGKGCREGRGGAERGGREEEGREGKRLLCVSKFSLE